MPDSNTIENFEFERRLWSQGYKYIMGLDEVGRGCLAGPVVAAGVIFPSDVHIDGITDSKLLSESRRLRLADEIKSNALTYIIDVIPPPRVDTLNVYWASFAAMDNCIERADNPSPDYVLVDGNRFPSRHIIPHTCIVKGDAKSVSIGAASILAKVYRDNLMKELHNKYPWYGWDTNVGYATKKHYAGLAEMGITPHHRKSFKLGTQKVLSPELQNYA